MRILLVEDEIKMARAIRRGLEQEGYAVDTVGDGEEALFRATESDYDGIVLDVMLPGMDGFAVCRALRSRDRRALHTANPSIPGSMRSSTMPS